MNTTRGKHVEKFEEKITKMVALHVRNNIHALLLNNLYNTDTGDVLVLETEKSVIELHAVMFLRYNCLLILDEKIH